MTMGAALFLPLLAGALPLSFLAQAAQPRATDGRSLAGESAETQTMFVGRAA